MKVLVTGGGGFLGKYIVKRLLDGGIQVITFQRGEYPELEKMGAKSLRGDLNDRESLRAALRGCGAVLHVAAKAGVWGRRRDYFNTNVEGTRSLLGAMQEANIDRLVYCSTPSVVFTGDSHHGADESLPYGKNWLCHYAESKAIAEKMVLEWGRAGRRVIALRPHLVWGNGDPHLLPKVIERCRAGRLWIIGNGTNRVDITRVENAAEAHFLALRALDREDAVNRPYFLSQGEPVLLWEWINSLLQMLEIRPLSKRISLKAAYRIGAFCELLWGLSRRRSVPPMTRFVAVELARDHWFSIDAAREQLEYLPEKFSTDKGMKQFAADWSP